MQKTPNDITSLSIYVDLKRGGKRSGQLVRLTNDKIILRRMNGKEKGMEVHVPFYALTNACVARLRLGMYRSSNTGIRARRPIQDYLRERMSDALSRHNGETLDSISTSTPKFVHFLWAPEAYGYQYTNNHLS